MAAVQGAPVKHTDGTTWLEAGAVLALWAITSTAATVFKIVADGPRATLAPLYVRCAAFSAPTVVSDSWTSPLTAT